MLAPELEFLPYDKLEQLSEALASCYQSAQPFPHVVIYNFLSEDAFASLSATFPGPDADIWFKFRSGRENLKLQSTTLRDLPWTFKLFMAEVNGPDVTRFLETLTGISGLIPDPYPFGGGLHQTLSGGHLGVHIDYNLHKQWRLDRRLNAILYMNDQWEESLGRPP